MMQYSQDIYFSVLLCCMHVCLLAPCYMHYFTCIMHHFMCNMHSILCAICILFYVQFMCNMHFRCIIDNFMCNMHFIMELYWGQNINKYFFYFYEIFISFPTLCNLRHLTCTFVFF